MKFTEGYWLRSEDVDETYAVQNYTVEALLGPDRMRVVSPGRRIDDRGGALDVSTITTEFCSINENAVGVRCWHFEGWTSTEPMFEKTTAPCPVDVEIGRDEAVMRAGNLTVRVDRKEFGFTFEAGGRVLTSCGFRNLGYMRVGRKKSTMLPKANYLSADYDPYMAAELSLDVGECVYGLGERFTPFVKNGQTVDIWNEDGGTASQVSYKNIPFYMTNRGYGVFVDHTSNVSFEVASEKVSYVGFSVPGEELRYMIIYGQTPEEILSNYTAVTGRPALPPAWSFGLWLSTSFTSDYDEKTAMSFIDGMAEREIPLSVFHFDCFWMKALHWCDFKWDGDVFPDVTGMLKRCRDKGLKICVWINPYIAQGTEAFRECCEKGLLLKRADGKGVRQLDNWQPGMGIVDFTNPDACAWYAAKLRGLLDVGVDSFKTDFGERIPTDVVYHNGADPVGMHNYYTQLYNKCVFDALREARGEGKAVVFARSATAGGQQFPVHWGGDNTAAFTSMAESLRGGLSFAMSGFSFWSHDIGGFEMTASPGLYKRWVQFGLLSTHSRLHGSRSYRVPWLFGDEASEVLRAFTKLKCRLMPYIYEMAVKAHRTGVPVMRPMPLAFPGDPAADCLDRQYMLGDSLLVAPVFREDGEADYYLPEAGKTWTHLLSEETRAGGRWYRDKYDFFSLPLYVRDGTLLPWGAVDARPDYDYVKDLTLRLYAQSLTDGQEGISCAVPDLSGRDALTAKITVDRGTVTLDLSHPCENLTLQLRGAATVTGVKGGELTGSPETGDLGIHSKSGASQLSFSLNTY